MSNEHEAPRNDDPPRTDDGRPVHDAPRIDDGSGHGDQRSESAGDAPRYGERITPSAAEDTPTQAWDRSADDRTTSDHRDGAHTSSERAADATPTQAYAAHDGTDRGQQWSDQQPTQQYQQQQYANQHDAGQHHGQYGTSQQAAAPVYGQPNDPSWQAYDEPKPVRKKKTVGVIAFVVALLALVAGIVGGYLFGHIFSDPSFREAIQNSSGGAMTQAEQERLSREVMSDPAVAGQAAGAGVLFLVGTVLGIWAIVQGIIAAVAGRGRAFGVLAIVIAVVALIVAIVVIGATAGSAVQGL